MCGQRFPKNQRLLSRRQFVRLTRCGRRLQSAHFLLLWAPRSAGRSRLGITVTRRLGKATARNRLKRLVRESFRQSSLVPPGLDLALVAQRGADALGYAQLDQELCGLWQRLRELRRQ